MIKISALKRLLLLTGFLLIFIFLLIQAPAVNATGPISYQYSYGGKDNTYTNYFPLNAANQFITYPYPIYVWWQITVGDAYEIDSCTEAQFQIQYYSNGVATQSAVYEAFHDSTRTGRFLLPANTGICVSLFTGDWKHRYWHHLSYHTRTGGFDCSYTITYELDDVAPDAPSKPEVGDDETIYKTSDKIYTRYNPTLKLAANDHGPVYSNCETISGIKDYFLFINGLQQEKTVTSPCTLSLAEGENDISVKARDMAGNIGPLSEGLALFVDQTIPTTPGQPYIQDHKSDKYISSPNLTWTWDQSNDATPGSGLKGYQVYIAKADGTVVADWVNVTTNSYSHPVEDGTSYTCKVRAIDNVGNQSYESQTNSISVDLSVPEVTLKQYPIHQNGNNLILGWNAVTDNGVGLDKYEVILTGSAADPDNAQANIIEKNTTSDTDYTFATPISSQKKYYAWVRAIDRLGNKGTWQRTGPFPNYTIEGPADGAYTGSTVKLGVTSNDGTTLKFRIGYKLADIQYSPYDSSLVTLSSLSEGKYQWWLEIYEGTDTEPQITGDFSFTVDNTAPPQGSNSFRIQSLSGSTIYDNGNNPTNAIQVKLSDITLYDAGSGIKELYFWNGESTTPPSDAFHKIIKESGPDKSSWKLSEDINWNLVTGDGQKTVAMEVVDNAGNATLVTYQVLLDTTLPPAPDQSQLSHTTSASQITFNWQADNTNGDVAKFQGQYTLPDGTSQSYTVTPVNNGTVATGTLTVPASSFGPNLPVTLSLSSVDKAGNQSAPITYTAYTQASLGSLQNLDGGYDTTQQQFFLSWQIPASTGAAAYILEYGKADSDTNQFTVLATLSPLSGIFTHNGLTAHGSYSYRLVALNSSGDRTEGEVFTRQVPDSAPTIPQIIPLSYARDEVTFQYTPATDVDGDTLTYTIYLKLSDQTDYKALSSNTAQGLVNGQTYNWYVVADDGYNGRTASGIGAFTVDTIAPMLSIETARYTYTNQSQLSITASDALSGIDHVSYTKISATDNTTLDSGTIDLTDNGNGNQSGVIALTEGNYHLHFTAFDKAGNSTAVEVNNLRVDLTAPVLGNPQLKLDQDGGKYLSTGTMPVGFSATDNAGAEQSGVTTLRYWVLSDKNAPLGSGQTIALSSNLQQFSQVLNLSGASGNPYYLALAVEDAAGNRSTVNYFGPILLDTTAPEVSLALAGLTRYGSNQYLNNSDNLTATCTANDPESGIASTQFAILDSNSGQAVSPWGAWESVRQTALTAGTSYQVAVKVTNKAGLTTEVDSESFIYDNSAPQNLTVTGPTGAVVSGQQVAFTVNAADPETSVTEYHLAISASDGTKITTASAGNQNGWLIQSGNQFRFELPTAADGTYTVNVEAVNAAGLVSATNIPLSVNNTQEIVIVSDQGPYSGLGDHLTGWWKYNGSKTVSSYQYRIINMEGKAVSDWATTQDTQATAANLKLESAKEYQFQVQANFSDGSSLTGTSAGVTIDTTIPVINTLVTPTYSTSADLKFSWSAADNESGIAGAWVALGSNYGQNDISGGWIKVSGASSALTRDINGKPLNLTSGKTCYITLRVLNGAGLETEKAAPGVIIDNATPPTPVVTDQGDYINPTKQPLKANWIWTPFDANGGTTTYQWALVPYGTNISSAAWTDAGGNTEISTNQPDLPDGANYRFAVKATNQAGLTSIGYSDGIMIDKNAPIIPDVTLNQAINMGESEATYVTDTNNLTLSINSYDLNGITVYEYTYGSQTNITGSTDYSSSSTNSFAVAPTVGSDQVTVYKAVCSDGASNISQAGYSSGVILDPGAPQITNVKGSLSGNTMMFNWDVIPSVSPVVSYEYALVPEAKMNDTPASWISAALNRSISIDVTALADGKYRLLIRGLNAAGTYSRRQNSEWGISPSIILDRQAPVMDPSGFNYSTYADSAIQVNATATDNLSGIGGYQYALGTLTNPTLYSGGWVDVESSEGSIQFNVPTSSVPHNSLVYLMVRAKDNVSLWSTALISQKILIDHTVPTTPVVSYSSGAYTTSKSQLNGIAFISSDPESIVTHYRIGIVATPGGDWQSIEEAPIDQFDNTLPYLSLSEGQVVYIAVQTCNGAGVWSDTGYSQAITVDTIPPVLEFTSGNTTVVLNTPPVNIEYTLSEAASVSFTLSAADGTAQTSTANGVSGVNNFVFNQSTPQTYTLTATPVDPAGNTGIVKTQSIRVNAPPQISIKPVNATPGEVLQLSASVVDPDGTAVAYSWNLGDGTISNEVSPTHSYRTTGTYTVTLAVTDNDGGVSSAASTVSVGNTTSGSLYADETWSGTQYVYGDITVPAGITLTVAPGTQVIVENTSGSGYTIDIKGILVIQSASQAVSFGSSNGQAGGWKGIYLEGQATLDGVTIGDAERGLTVVSGATATLKNCIFQNNQTGLHVYGTTPTVSSCSFLNNSIYGIKEDEGGRPVVNGCNFSGNGMDYYSESDTDLSMDELNAVPGNGGNK